MTPLNPLPTDLPGLEAHLERHGWDFKRTSARRPDGTRLHTASVWKSDELGGSNKHRHADPVQALTAALLDARRKRGARAQELKKAGQP